MGDICPLTRCRCDTAEMCHLFFCAKGGPRANARPLNERNLTKAERYAMLMAEQRKAGG